MKTNRVIVDANSGVVLWEQHDSIRNAHSVKMPFVAHPLGFIHPQEDTMSPVVLTDRLTGEVKVSYDEGVRYPKPNANRPGHGLSERDKFATGGELCLLAHNDTLVQIKSYDLVVVDIPTGKVLWRKEMKNPSTRGVIGSDGVRLYVQEVAVPGMRRGKIGGLRPFGRWGSNPTVALACYELATGKELWRNETFATKSHLIKGKMVEGPTDLSQFMEIDGVLYAYDHVSNIMSDHHADFYVIDVQTGKILSHDGNASGKDPNHREFAKHGPMTNNLVYWNGYFSHKNGILPKDNSGLIRGKHTVSIGGNQRCVRTTATGNYIIRGHTGYYGKDGSVYQTFLTRGNCAMPNYPTHGAMMSVTDETCACYNGLRGNVALVPPVTFTPVADDQRLSQPATLPINSVAATSELPRTALTKSWIQYFPMRLHWNQHARSYDIGDGMTLTHDIQRHRITATKDGSQAWEYRADGRVLGQAMLHEGMVYVPSFAGTLTALNAATGEIVWRFLAAPTQDQVVINGQVESRWPVHNSVIHEGTLYVGAGTHSETDGGIYLWGLDPASGEIKSRANIFANYSANSRTAIRSTQS